MWSIDNSFLAFKTYNNMYNIFADPINSYGTISYLHVFELLTHNIIR